MSTILKSYGGLWGLLTTRGFSNCKQINSALLVILMLLLATMLAGTAQAASGDLIWSWSSPITGAGHFYPYGLAVDDVDDQNQQIYVIDRGSDATGDYYDHHRVLVFNQTGTFQREWGSFGTGDGQFYNPARIVLDAQLQEAYVTDPNNHRIQVFYLDGTFKRKWGSYGTGDRQFSYPHGILIDNQGDADVQRPAPLIYIADWGNSRIQVFDQSGNFLRKWNILATGPDVQFNYPASLAMDSLGQIYVVGAYFHRVLVYDKTGILLRQWGSLGSDEGQFDAPLDIAIDGKDRIYVADAHNHRIEVFDRDGNFLWQWSILGADGQSSQPQSITIDIHGHIYVTDSNRRIQMFEGGDPPVPDHTPPAISLTAHADQLSYVLNTSEPANYTCSDAGSGVATCDGPVVNGSPFDTATVEWKNFTVNATDKAGNHASLTHAYQVIYAFTGFFAPVDNAPILNVAKAGSAIPIKFSLAGNQGLAIFEAAPASQTIACDTTLPRSDLEDTVTAGGSSLTYDSATNQYIYVWKTDKSWATTCRQWVMHLKDGTEQRANFEFTK